MALLFNYSCNGITNASQFPHAFSAIYGSPTVGVGDGPGATPINTFHTDGSTKGGWLPNIGIPINAQGLIIGCGFNVTAFGSAGPVNLITIGSSGSGNFNGGVILQVSNDGSMQLSVAGSFPPTGASSPSGVFTFGARHEVELKISSFAATNSCTVYLDGVAVTNLTGLQLTGLTTTPDGSTVHSVLVGGSTATGAFSGNPPSQTTIVCDSVYACDTLGSFFNAPQGPCISIPYIPSGVGNKSQWTPNGAATGWQCLENVPPDSTEYINDNTVGHEEAVALTGPADITAVYGVSVIATQRQDTGGGGRVNALGVGNGSSQNYSSAFALWALGTTYKTNTAPYGFNPITGVAWTLGDLTTVQAAVKVNT
jgi:hypothetical protein